MCSQSNKCVQGGVVSLAIISGPVSVCYGESRWSFFGGNQGWS